jgi:adenosylcobyric acid synthase
MKSIMVIGTMNQVGKSFLTTALCRILSRRGWRIAPFKSQVLARNTYMTSIGGEVGYMQAVQAWAAGTMPRVEMNPVLLKPQDSTTAQLVLRGKPVGTMPLHEYGPRFVEVAWQAVEESLQSLSDEFDLLVCEGHGSPVEIHLKPHDIVNMRVARHLNAVTILVVDIERGGAFAQVAGTLALMTPEERSLIKGIVLNRLKGSRAPLQIGIDWLQEQTGIPVIGIIPPLDQSIMGMDSLSFFNHESDIGSREITIDVVRLPRISNFTDIDPLESEPTVSVRYIGLKDSLNYPDAVILPGSKAAIPDLLAMKNTGFLEQLQNYAAAGGTVLGICGGFQIMGKMLADPEGIEGQEGRYKGLGLVPLKTVITRQKISRQRTVTSNYPQTGLPIAGYEYCSGRSHLEFGSEDADEIDDQSDWKPLFDDRSLGIVDTAQMVWGTYLHGIFDNGPWRRAWLNRLRQQRGLKSLPTGISNYREQREMLLDSLADGVEAYLNLDPILQYLEA